MKESSWTQLFSLYIKPILFQCEKSVGLHSLTYGTNHAVHIFRCSFHQTPVHYEQCCEWWLLSSRLRTSRDFQQSVSWEAHSVTEAFPEKIRRMVMEVPCPLTPAIVCQSASPAAATRNKMLPKTVGSHPPKLSVVSPTESQEAFYSDVHHMEALCSRH